ncbi:uncharacterized protein [Argopecten irradians]|uniref:uncharacterized protein n=1 Tax=Argopecten irradians TaxID=31199 RepID=UPI0037234618
MMLSSLLLLLVLSAVSSSTSLQGSLSCLLRCQFNTDCHCNIQLDQLTGLIERQIHHHHHHHTNHPEETTTPSTPEPEVTPIPMRMVKTTTVDPKLKTTTDICDTLCKIQLGGDACDCSHPVLPGRR